MNTNSVIIVSVLTLVPIGLGTLFLAFARPIAKFHVWWEKRCTELRGLRCASQFMYDEQTSLTILRVLGVSFVVLGFVVPLLAVILIYRFMRGRGNRAGHSASRGALPQASSRPSEACHPRNGIAYLRFAATKHISGMSQAPSMGNGHAAMSQKVETLPQIVLETAVVKPVCSK